jgi:hypothetical protein
MFYNEVKTTEKRNLLSKPSCATTYDKVNLVFSSSTTDRNRTKVLQFTGVLEKSTFFAVIAFLDLVFL